LTTQQQHFQALTQPWRDRLFSMALRKAGIVATAEDWVQETLLRAWRDFDRLSDHIAIYAWLLKILDHVVSDELRRDDRRQRIAPVISVEDTVLQEHPNAAPGPFEQTLQQQSDEQMIAAIQTLPEPFSNVILLRDIEGLSYRDVADVLNIPQGTVMSRLSRGRRLLAHALINQQHSIATTLQNSDKLGHRQ
jgi:RNA polymerase sigma-70 factor (ECF subfamily)